MDARVEANEVKNDVEDNFDPENQEKNIGVDVIEVVLL